MGVNNRQRRAAKQRKRSRGTGRPTPPRVEWGDPGPASVFDADAAYALADLHITAMVRRIGSGYADTADVRARAETVLRQVSPTPDLVVHEVAFDLLGRILAPVLAGGWGPADLVELVSRCSDPVHMPALLTALHEETRRNRERGAPWQALLDAHGRDPRTRFDTAERLASVLAVTALLIQVPLLNADSVTDLTSQAHEPETDAHPKLARVRALLAKAESTTFPDEAEALTAKAQELIARYSLESMVDRARGRSGGADLVTRRIWLDAPYVRPKGSLVAVAAEANHCRTALSEPFGFCIVVGSGHDLDAVELLVTSLLVQAQRAMLVHGSQVDRRGASRTRSFRQSFLFAYADRIGQRLADASDAVAAEQGESFLPVLRSHEEQVADAFDALVPHTVGRSRQASNDDGWAAGVAAADQAVLDFREEITETA